MKMSFFELYLVTFNCERRLVSPEALAPNLFDALPPSQAIPDLFAISLQELAPISYSFLGGSFLSPYFEQVSAAVQLAADIRSNGQQKLEHVATRSIGMTGLMVFAKPDFAERIRWMQDGSVGVGFWNMGNKGAVGLRLGITADGGDLEENNEQLILTLVAAHLAPMEWNVERRNQDWENIVRNLVFTSSDSLEVPSIDEQPLLSSQRSLLPPDNSGIYEIANHVFFAGDLNYRTNDNPPGKTAHTTFPQPTESKSSPQHLSHLLATDQLNRERAANRTLHGFEETAITFPPTYKYSIKEIRRLRSQNPSSTGAEEHWPWATHRWPSFTDRILYTATSLPELEIRTYTALPLQPTSDHRPVALSLRVKLEPLASERGHDLQYKRPFPINPYWKTRKNIARSLELVVGISSYLALTRTGNAILVVVSGISIATWWMVHWIQGY